MKPIIALTLALLLAACGLTNTVEQAPWAKDVWDNSNQGGTDGGGQ